MFFCAENLVPRKNRQLYSANWFTMKDFQLKGRAPRFYCNIVWTYETEKWPCWFFVSLIVSDKQIYLPKGKHLVWDIEKYFLPADSFGIKRAIFLLLLSECFGNVNQKKEKIMTLQARFLTPLWADFTPSHIRLITPERDRCREAKVHERN